MALFLTVARAVLFAIVIHYAYDVYLRHLNHIMKKQKEVHNELEVYNMGHDLMEVTSEPDAALVSVHNDKESTALQVTEALTCLKSAMYLYEEGKLERATKLFDHAINLAPNHPDILNQYGHFIETVRSDVIAADHMYFKALIISPSHQGALDNRRRVAAVVEEIDKSILQKIDEKRDRVASIPESNFALRKAKREAYFQHIYHTVGIEGNTMTLSQTRSIVETRMAIGGKSIAEHNEILGLDSAVKYLNATLGNRHSNITIENILEIHKRVLGHVDPTEGGFFRRAQVFVGDHIPPGPSEIVKLMNEFEIWINTWGKTLHPVEHAALAHYRLVHIHPFYDGNGRTARLVMNMILMRAGFPPVIILKQDRQKYYELLEIGNGGDVRPFVRFIAQCTERTLDHFLWTTSEFSSEIPAIGKIDGYTSAITPV